VAQCLWPVAYPPSCTPQATPRTPAIKRGIRAPCSTTHALLPSRSQARSIASPINRANSATARDHFLGEGGLFPRPPPDSLPVWLGPFGGDDFPPPPLVPPFPPFELFATDMAPAVRGAAPPTRRSPPAPSADLVGSAGSLVRESALRVPWRTQRFQHDSVTTLQSGMRSFRVRDYRCVWTTLYRWGLGVRGPETCSLPALIHATATS
jgi:hypothetical protein